MVCIVLMHATLWNGNSTYDQYMKQKTIYFAFLILAAFYISSCQSNSPAGEDKLSPESFNNDWKFSLTEEDASASDFDDKNWRKLDLPHDWSIEGQISETNPSGMSGGFMPGGIGWYRKYFKTNTDWEGRKVYVIFDGVYMNSTVYLNGKELGHRPYGYSTFQYDLTPYLNDGENVIAVKVDNSLQPSGRWYTGSGIYRNVWLSVKNMVHIPLWGIHVQTPEAKEEMSVLSIETKLQSGKDIPVFIIQSLYSSEGENVSENELQLDIKAGASPVLQTLSVPHAKLWSPASPYLYKLETIVTSNGEIVDKQITQVGFRSIKIEASTGFWLNGEKLKMKGVCLHHDAGNLGAAVPIDVLYRRLKILKEMGCNAIRTSHNPFAPEFYHLCDSMGFLVLDEAFDGWDVEKAKYDYGLYFEDWWERDLTDFILRDRNHPSVVMWSIGNEVKGRTNEVEQKLVDCIRNLDTTRTITIGGGHDAHIVDIAGFNGVGEWRDNLETVNKEHPEWPVIGTEVPHTWQTRGVYRTKTWIRGRDFHAPWAPQQTDPNRIIDTTKIFFINDLTEKELFEGIDPNYLSSYDNAFFRICAREQWQRTDTFDFMLGEFRWTGIDYLGENIYPNRGWHCGVIDLCGFPKDTYYYYQSQWTDKPMVHILPHWTHHGKEGVSIPVIAYSNCEEVELFLNGTSQGVQKNKKYWNSTWYVPYQEGELLAIGKNNGTEVVRFSANTAGETYELRLEADRLEVNSSKHNVIHVICKVVDKNGVMVPDANHEISFAVNGSGTILATENGDMLDHTLSTSDKRKAFNGMCIAYIASQKDKRQNITVTARSGQLKPSKLEVLLK